MVRSSTSLLALLCALPLAAAQTNYASQIKPLIDPAKLATLGTRRANPRVQKYVYWLERARLDHQDPAAVAAEAVRSAGYTNQAAAALTTRQMLLNLRRAESFGCLDADGLDQMRRGNSPIVKKGNPNAIGDKLSVDHIIPLAVCPELDCVIANLELLPLRTNESKNASITSRQVDLATKLHAAAMLTQPALDAVLRSAGTN